MASNEFSLVLNCGGHKHNGLTMCSGTCNVLLDFNRHFEPLELSKIMDFLDFACGLFDHPMGDWNKVTNTLKILRDRFSLLDDKMWEALHRWLPQHKRCGAFLKLVLNLEVPFMLSMSQEALVLPERLKS